MRKSLVLFVLMGVTGSVLAEEVYRWVDADGVVNFTQQRPRAVTAEQISTRDSDVNIVSNVAQNTAAVSGEQPQSFPATASGQSRQMDAAQQEMLEGLRAEEAQRQIELADARDSNCKKSRDVLARLTGKSRIRVRGSDGVERMMPEDERQRRIDDAQMGVANNCTSA
jgi:hypothetical protein